jgi:tetratricopeptide (TPR) repeat protein
MDTLEPEAAIERAHAAEGAGDHQRALEIYTQALGDHSRSPDLYYFRGRCLFGLGRSADAIADLTRALELQPVFLSALLFRALARYKMGNHRGAISDNTEALKFSGIEPEFAARILYARAMSHLAIGKGELAEQDFDAARYHDPEGKFDPRS